MKQIKTRLVFSPLDQEDVGFISTSVKEMRIGKMNDGIRNTKQR